MNLKKIAIAMSLGFAAVGASAQITGDIAVSASVVAACNVVANPLSFGSYDSLATTALDASAALSIACSPGSIPVISLGVGNNSSGSQRRMNLGVNMLSYNLFQPVSNAAGAACAYTTPFGDGTLGSTLTATAALNITARSYNVCGRIPTAQSVPPGSYADTVVATINF